MFKSFLSVFALSFLLTPKAMALSFDADVPSAVQAQFQSDLAFINQVQGSGQTPLHQQIFGSVSGASYKKFFESRVVSVGLSECGGGGGVVACVIPSVDPHKMWLTNNFVMASIPMVARLMTIYHEARHTEAKNNHWDHATCPVPFLDKNGKDILGIVSGVKMEGRPACDDTVFGSYGSSTIMVKNLAKYCTNCNDKMKMDATIWSDDQAKRLSNPLAAAQLAKDFKN